MLRSINNPRRRCVLASRCSSGNAIDDWEPATMRKEKHMDRIRRRPLRFAHTVLAVLLVGAVGCGDDNHNGGKGQQGFMQTDLVSNLAGQAPVTDAHLTNAWGLAHTATGPWWVAANHSGVSTVYDGNGMPFPVGSPLIVTIPPPNGSPPGAQAAPTGMLA